VLSVFLAVVFGDSFELGAVFAAGALVAAVGSAEIRTRLRLWEVGVLIGAAQFVATWGVSLVKGTALDGALFNSMLAFLNGVIVGFVASAVLPILERTMGLVTGISLIEVADLNRPILKQLAIEAPGTFNHSLGVGTLAEAAAAAVGADSILCRVGSYYHDVGKLRKPHYFVENQTGSISRHAAISPRLSSLVIIAHTKDGVEIAGELGLPHAIVEIIAQHHGTTRVEYFYKQALEKKAQDPNAQEVDEASFRYPGPRPRTAEAGIVMLADCVESASRTLGEITPAKLEGLVARIVADRVADGQLDECPLTMRDLRIVEKSLTKTLAAIYHSRISY
jgi:putative nucleotidyltransferase with HDIG domain